MTLEEIVDWLYDEALGLTDSQVVKIASALAKGFIRKPEVAVEIPPHLEREGSYLRLSMEEGESWVAISHVENVRHISYVELTLSSGDVLTIDVTAQELLEFLRVLTPLE